VGVAAGNYTVTAVPPTGLTPTPSGNNGSRSVTVGTSNVCAPDIGLGLNLSAIRGMTANGFTIGYWKNNVDKAISGKSAGTQVSAATIKCYTTAIGDFALTKFDNLTMKQASAYMGSNSSKAQDLLAKQLVASEYNYQNGAYLNGNRTLTFLFMFWGEYVLQNYSSYSSTYVINAKDWFDAYNNTHGGALVGP
jgi:hypothetical protein